MNATNLDMKPAPQREEALFQAAAQLTGGERAVFLNGACHGDPALRQRLESLLVAHDAKDSFLEPEAPESGREPLKTIKLGNRSWLSCFTGQEAVGMGHATADCPV